MTDKTDTRKSADGSGSDISPLAVASLGTLRTGELSIVSASIGAMLAMMERKVASRPDADDSGSKVLRQGRSDRLRQLARLTMADLQTATIGVEPPSKGKIAIRGRLVEEGRTVSRGTVHLIDADDIVIAETHTDGAGGFAIDIDSARAKKGVRLHAADKDGQVLYADTKPRQLEDGGFEIVRLVADPEARSSRFTPRAECAPKAKSMPDLVGKSVYDAVRELEQENIPIAGAQVVRVRKGTGGDVTRTQPKSGQSLPPGTRVKMNVGATKDLQFRRATIAALVAANSGGAVRIEKMQAALDKAGEQEFSGLEGARKLVELNEKSFARVTGLGEQGALVREILAELVESFEHYRED